MERCIAFDPIRWGRKSGSNEATPVWGESARSASGSHGAPPILPGSGFRGPLGRRRAPGRVNTHRLHRRGSGVTSTAPPDSRLPRNIWAVTLTSFLTDASTETLTGLLPFFLSGTLGAPAAAIGLIEGVADATASLVKLGSGRLSDLWRRRKPLAVSGYALSTAAKALLLAVRSWPGVLAIRFLERSGKGTPHRAARRPAGGQHR